jgi:hypothetical protein
MATKSITSNNGVNTDRILRAAVFSVLAAVAANVVLRVILFAIIDLPADFPPLQTVMIALFTAVGTAAGAVVFALIARRARNPIRTYWIVAMVALVLSILPNFGAMANPGMMPFPSGSALTFGVLILFHIMATFVSVLVLTRLSAER